MWGQGKQSGKNPGPIHKKIEANVYGKKKIQSDVASFDPREEKFRHTTQHELNNFITSLQVISQHRERTNWEDALKLRYEDFVPSQSELSVLKENCDEYASELFKKVLELPADDLSTNDAVHVKGTEDQAKSDLWKEWRKFRITASIGHDFANSPKQVMKKFWNLVPDISSNKYIKWGIQNETNAVKAFEKRNGVFTQQCGLFISKARPYLGASPDAICGDSLIGKMQTMNRSFGSEIRSSTKKRV